MLTAAKVLGIPSFIELICFTSNLMFSHGAIMLVLNSADTPKASIFDVQSLGTHGQNDVESIRELSQNVCSCSFHDIFSALIKSYNCLVLTESFI